MKKPKHIYQALYFAVVTAVFVALSLIILRTKNVFIEEYSTISASRSNMAANYISSYLTTYAENLSGLTDSDVVSAALGGDGEAVSEIDSLITQSPLFGSNINYVSLISADKKTICSTSAQPDLSPEVAEILNRANIGPVISNIMPKSLDNVFIIAVPVFENKELRGYIMSELSVKVFSKTHGNLILNKDSSFILFDGNNAAFTLTTGEPSLYTYEELTDENNKDVKNFFISNSDIYFENLGSGWKVFYLLSGSNLFAAFRTFELVAAAVCLIMIIIGIFTIYTLKKSILAPLGKAAEEIDLMCKNESYRLLEPNSEFQSLSVLTNSVNTVLRGMMNGEAAVLFLMRKYADLFEEKNMVFLKWDLNTLKFTVSPIYKDIFGIDFIPYGSKAFSPERLGIHPDDAARFNDLLKDIRLGRKTAPSIYRKKTADGKYRYFEYTFAIACDSLGSPLSVLGCIMDVDRFVRTEIALKRAAELDRYTGVYNKYTYMQKLKERFAEAKSSDETICISLICLHNYYDLEDEKIGAGEEALKFLANVISENIDCTVGRILDDALGIYSMSENLTFLCDQIVKELNLGFYCNAIGSRRYTKTTSAIFLSDSVPSDFDLLISKFVKEYERFKPSAQNTYYFADPNK